MTIEQMQTEELARQYVTFLDKQNTDIKKLTGGSDVFKKIRETYTGAIVSCMEKAKNRIEEVRNGAIWDNLVIAFFGETNAGKSTIIETFRILFGEEERVRSLQESPEGVDGLIVGNGQSDYTQVYKEYKMNIQGVPFTLIDVPGIEGNEGAYENEIKEALNKAHYVFYVQGQKKKPDAGTAEKIKKYLNEWVRVYSVYNVRGIASNYDEDEERRELLSESDRKVVAQITDTFKAILGNTYVGNISLQAYLALCSKAKFSPQRSDLKKAQDKILSYFGSSDSIYEFSGFESIIDVVSSKASNFKQEILEANKEKHKTLLRAMYNEISSVSKLQYDSILALNGKIKTFVKNIKSDFTSSKNRLSSIAQREYDRLFAELEAQGVYAIDNKKTEDYLKSAANTALRLFKERLNGGITDEIDSLQDKINKRRVELEQQMVVKGVDAWVDIDFGLEIHNALKELEISIGDVTSFVLGAAGALLTGIAIWNFWHPGGWIAGIIAGVFLIFGGRDRKSAAKNELRNKLREEKAKNKEELDSEIKGIKNELDTYCAKLVAAVNVNKTNIEKLSDYIKTTSETLKLEYSKLNISEYGKY